ncbi:MAG: hypothetical protein Q9162_003593 [Coniocarpon cinnabarinum]
MLILKNVDVPINDKSATYENVLTVWIIAMKRFDALVQGVPQTASGELLAAMASWHLYPDIAIVEPTPKQVELDDELLPRCAVVTIGLQTRLSARGLVWSLPLERLRHYGAPVKVDKRLQDLHRLPFKEVGAVLLGSFLAGWKELGSDPDVATLYLNVLQESLEHLQHQPVEGHQTTNYSQHLLTLCRDGGWLGLIFCATKGYLDSDSNQKENYSSLLYLGRTKGADLLGEPTKRLFDFLDNGAYVRYIASEEERIQFLRRVAEDTNIDGRDYLIRYRYSIKRCHVYEFATAKVLCSLGPKRSHDGSLVPSSHHRRWLFGGAVTRNDHTFYECGKAPAGGTQEMIPLLESDQTNGLRQEWQKDYNLRKSRLNDLGEMVYQREFERGFQDVSNYDTGSENVYLPGFSTKSPWFRRVYGDNVAGLYVTATDLGDEPRVDSPDPSRAVQSTIMEKTPNTSRNF